MNALIYGLEVAVIGMVVVFIGLAILIGIVKVMTVILNKKEEPAPKPAAPVVPTAPAAPAPAPIAAAPAGDDAAVVAAIMAAISCMYEGTGKRPVVRAVRAVRRSSADWKHAYM